MKAFLLFKKVISCKGSIFTDKRYRMLGLYITEGHLTHWKKRTKFKKNRRVFKDFLMDSSWKQGLEFWPKVTKIFWE